MSSTSPENMHLSERARRHLWMHFSRMAAYEDHEVPVIVRGEGAWVWDQHGKRYLVGLAELLAALSPGELNRVFFTTGGSEAVESAWKLARHFFRMTGEPQRTKV